MTRSSQVLLRRLLAVLPLLGVLLWTLAPALARGGFERGGATLEARANPGETPAEAPGRKTEGSEARQGTEDEREPESEHGRGPGSRLSSVEISILRARCAALAHPRTDDRLEPAPMTGGAGIRGPPGCP